MGLRSAAVIGCKILGDERLGTDRLGLRPIRPAKRDSQLDWTHFERRAASEIRAHHVDPRPEAGRDGDLTEDVGINRDPG